jgi:hypothetical protein
VTGGCGFEVGGATGGGAPVPGERAVVVRRRAAVGRGFGVGGAEENTGVTGAGGRRGALCAGCGAENVAAGGGPAGVRFGAAGAAGAALLNATGAGRPPGRVAGGWGA